MTSNNKKLECICIINDYSTTLVSHCPIHNPEKAVKYTVGDGIKVNVCEHGHGMETWKCDICRKAVKECDCICHKTFVVSDLYWCEHCKNQFTDVNKKAKDTQEPWVLKLDDIFEDMNSYTGKMLPDDYLFEQVTEFIRSLLKDKIRKVESLKIISPDEQDFEEMSRKMVFGSGQMNMQVRVLEILKK